MGLTVRFAALVAAAALVVTSVAQGQPEPDSLARVELLQNTLAAVADEVRPSVVAIRADRRVGMYDPGADNTAPPDDQISRQFPESVIPAVGSGIVISADGLILTNEHVIHNADPESIEVLIAGERYAVRGITSDPRSDLAVLRIDARSLKPLRLGDLSTVRQGHFAIVMGNPFGSASDNHGTPALSFGVISALGQDLTHKLDPGRYYGNLIQTDARINPGNSGGPLLNIKGEVIGLNTAISTRSGGNEGVGYAIAIDERTKEIITQLSRGEEVEYGYLGVRLAPPKTGDLQPPEGASPGGALIMDVEFGTSAAAAGLQAGDLVVKFAGRPVDSVDQLIRLVGAARVGVKVTMTVCRNQRRLNLTVVPARREGLPRGVNIEVPLSWRGMQLASPTPEIRKAYHLPDVVRGVVVTRLEPGGPADRAGLEPGQVIRQVNQVPVKGLRRLRQIAPDLAGPVKIILDADPPIELTLP